MRLQDYYSGIVRAGRLTPPTRDEARRDYDIRRRDFRRAGIYLP